MIMTRMTGAAASVQLDVAPVAAAGEMPVMLVIEVTAPDMRRVPQPDLDNVPSFSSVQAPARNGGLAGAIGISKIAARAAPARMLCVRTGSPRRFQ
jgi:hypothetical protein